MTEAERITLTQMLTPLGTHYLSEIRNDLWVAYNNNGFCGPYCTERMFTHLSRMAAVRDLETFHKVRTGTANPRYTDIEQYEIDIIDPDEPSVHYYYTVEKIARWNIAKFTDMALQVLVSYPGRIERRKNE